MAPLPHSHVEDSAWPVYGGTDLVNNGLLKSGELSCLLYQRNCVVEFLAVFNVWFANDAAQLLGVRWDSRLPCVPFFHDFLLYDARSRRLEGVCGSILGCWGPFALSLPLICLLIAAAIGQSRLRYLTRGERLVRAEAPTAPRPRQSEQLADWSELTLFRRHRTVPSTPTSPESKDGRRLAKSP
jgi:hypothetical protein